MRNHTLKHPILIACTLALIIASLPLILLITQQQHLDNVQHNQDKVVKSLCSFAVHRQKSTKDLQKILIDAKNIIVNGSAAEQQLIDDINVYNAFQNNALVQLCPK